MGEILGRCIFPLILFIIIQILLFLAGMNLNSTSEMQAWDGKAIIKTYVCGQMLVWTVLLLLAVPMILSRLRFSILFCLFVVIVALLCILGLRRFLCLKNRRVTLGRFSSLSVFGRIILVVTILFIIFQVLTYFLGQHIDQDDARWLAEANDALVYGDMMTRNVSTGELLGWFDTFRDVTSPWPMFFAVLAKILHVNTAIAAHTIYAPFALIMSYCVYYLLASELFSGIESRLVFVFAVSWINLFYAGTTMTQSVFALVRIWQGKATVAGILIPFLIYLIICINKRNETADWIRLAVTGCAGCLMSGMGVSLGAIIIIIFGAYSIFVFQRWKQIPLWILAMAPPVIDSLLYFLLDW